MIVTVSQAVLPLETGTVDDLTTFNGDPSRVEVNEETTMTAVPQNPTSSHVAALLPRLNDADSDLRYMSLNDLFSILNVGAPNFLASDYNTCARTIDGLLKTLDDQNGEVQNQSIKW